MQSDCRVVILVLVTSNFTAYQCYVQFIASPKGIGYFFTQSDGDIVIWVAKDLHVFFVDFDNIEVLIFGIPRHNGLFYLVSSAS